MSEEPVESVIPDPIWTSELGQNISQPPVVVGNTLLIASQPSGRMVQHSRLQGINLSDGSIQWHHDFEYSLVSGIKSHRVPGTQNEIAVTAASSSDFLNGKGFVRAYDEAGEVVWRWQAKEDNFSEPTLKGRQIFIIAGSKTLVAFCPEDGGCNEQRISLEVKPSLSAPAIHEGVAYIPCRSPDLLAMGLDGDVRWRFQFEGGNREWLDKTPVISGDHIFAVSSMGSLFALELMTGKLVWQTAVAEGRPLSQPVVVKDQIYVGSRNGMEAIDRISGRSRWTFSTSRPISATPLVHGSLVYVTCEDHYLYVLDGETGEETWKYEFNRRIEMPPVLAPTALFVVDRGGHIVAFEPPLALAEDEEVTEVVQDPAELMEIRKQTAEQYEEEEKPFEAAKIWHELGDLERAAGLFEEAGAWLEAAPLWLQIDRYGKRAQAIMQHARAISKQEDVSDEDKAAAWENAAFAFAESGDKDARTRSERQVFKYRQQPIIVLEIEEPDNMVVDAWVKLNYTLKNEGFGVARHVDVTVRDDRFEAQRARTQTIVTLRPDETYSHYVDVSPRSHGPNVPLQIVVEFIDKAGRIHLLERTYDLQVSSATAPIMSTGSWTQTGGTMGMGETAQLARMSLPGDRNPIELRNKLVQYFDRDEMLDILLELGLNEDDYDTKISSMTRDVIRDLVRFGRIEELIAICERERPNVGW